MGYLLDRWCCLIRNIGKNATFIFYLVFIAHQKINHFPGMFSLSRKNHLGKNLMKMRN